jgi:phosphogluconate dehydratase
LDLNQTVARVTDRVIERSAATRTAYLERIRAAGEKGPKRSRLSCSNLAHGFAACGPSDKQDLATDIKPNIAIVSSYNDMLSAHQPLETFPAIIKEAVHEAGGVAQFAGGVPAMCDGVTQGNAGMELSLFSRDVIAMSTAVAVSHDMFDGALMLGVCDKIVPGLVIGALSFGHLPTIMVPAGPMTSGLPNAEKSRIRQLYAEGKVGRDLHLPGAAFINPNTPLRDALTAAASRRVLEITAQGNEYTPAGEVVDERAVVNGVIGLLATGGSTNHTIHLIAMAHAAGIKLTWSDFADLSAVIPLLAKVYPNGNADVNHFHAAGGMGFVIRELLNAGLMHEDVRTVAGDGGMRRYAEEPTLEGGNLTWRPGPAEPLDRKVLGTVTEPFAPDGGIKMLDGNFGRAVIKTSAVKHEHRFVEAPARVFTDQAELQSAFKRGELHRDFVAVVTFQGPKANGMPELHKLTPPLGVLQDLGFHVALVTDGRMSGASGKVPAAIHITPEAASGGEIAKIRDGDIVRLDAEKGTLEVLVSAEEMAAREPSSPDLTGNRFGTGRDLFGAFRALVGGAEDGASVFNTAA